MGLLDKVKAQATVAAQKAQEAGKAGQEKLEEVQARRKLDGLYRELGAAVYAERAGAGVDGGAQERLVAEITALRAEIGD